jgi:hypothetical protein
VAAPDRPDLHPLLRDRRSVRAHDAAHTLGDDDLAALLDAARWAADASALVCALHQVASGPEPEALPYSDYAAYDGQAVAHLSVQAPARGLSTHQFAAFGHAGRFGEPVLPG